jgi:hypothetical protein
MLGLDGAAQLRWQREERKQQLFERSQRQLAQELQNHAVTVAPDDGHDVSDLLAQIGRPLSCQQVIERLRKCNPRLYFEHAKSDPTKVGVYLIEPTGQVYVTPRGEVLNLTHIFGMEAGMMPEFSVIHKTKTKVANQELFGLKEATRDVAWKQVETFASETRGWRTVLIRLLHAGLISRNDVEKHFGWTPSRNSQRWHEQTR